MNVFDIPQSCNQTLYDEAIARYAAMVKSRAVGVHQAGNIRYPGLSDIDLIVVTDHVGVDNRFFFSALQRLPQRYHRLFLHEPYVLPAWSLRVLCYTAHRSPKLIAGRDVLQPYAPNDDACERWCRTLESYCAYASFVAQARASQVLKGRRTVAAASTFRYVLADAESILPEASNASYADDIETVRRTFFDTGRDPVESVRTAWALLSAAFERFHGALAARLGCAGIEDTVATARARLLGEEACADFDRDYAFRRAREIGGYHQELASLGFPYGHLFYTEAHPSAVRTLPDARFIDAVLRNVYRVRRRLTEYAVNSAAG